MVATVTILDIAVVAGFISNLPTIAAQLALLYEAAPLTTQRHLTTPNARLDHLSLACLYSPITLC